MKCPHCLDSFFEEWQRDKIGRDDEAHWFVRYCVCPSCKRVIINLDKSKTVNWSGSKPVPSNPESYQVWPKGIARMPLPKEVPGEYANDYIEASLVLADSPKASAALGRRCLQHLLRDEAKVKPSNLSDEIEQVIPKLPSHLANAIDAVRNIGNFAAHPIKSTSTGEIVDVEPGEAEWLLDVLEGIFDFYFVHPATLARKREALDKKLSEAGKPEMK